MTLLAEKLNKTYRGRKIVNDLTLELHRNEIVGLLGPNGAGKTTTFHMIAGFIKPDRGRILLNGIELTHMPVYKRARLGLGYLPQEPSVFRKLTVQDNLRAILELLGKTRLQQNRTIEELLQKLNIHNLRHQKAATLSGGERRKLELARALASQPTLLLLDEPFTGIDPITRAEIQDIIRNLKTEGMGILITDHNVRETLEITDRAYIIYDARILISGTTQNLLRDEKTRQLYLGQRFRI